MRRVLVDHTSDYFLDWHNHGAGVIKIEALNRMRAPNPAAPHALAVTKPQSPKMRP
jgi:hypothetical protein